MTLEYSNLPSGTNTWVRILIKLGLFGSSMQVDIHWPTVITKYNSKLNIEMGHIYSIYPLTTDTQKLLFSSLNYWKTTSWHQFRDKRVFINVVMARWSWSQVLWSGWMPHCVPLQLVLSHGHTQSLVCGNQERFSNKTGQWSVLAAEEKIKPRVRVLRNNYWGSTCTASWY